MKTTVNIYDFEDAFHNHGRQEQFSHAGKRALFEHLEGLEDDIGEEIELDVIALCCQYTEYESIKEFNESYNTEHKSYEDIDITTAIPINDESFIIQNY